jgi:hypothetical protein
VFSLLKFAPTQVAEAVGKEPTWRLVLAIVASFPSFRALKLRQLQDYPSHLLISLGQRCQGNVVCIAIIVWVVDGPMPNRLLQPILDTHDIPTVLQPSPSSTSASLTS